MRLLTRADFDGLACGALLKEVGLVDSYLFVHPKDIQDGLVHATKDDVLTNIPYIEGCGMWFDHHASEIDRIGSKIACKGEARIAPSAARIVYEYFGGRGKMPHLETMVHYVDKVDSGSLTVKEISDPTGWVLLGFIMDPRTGLGRFRTFSIGNFNLMEMLMEACRKMDVEAILELPDVKERVSLYYEQAELFKDMISKHTVTDGNAIITDLRGVDPIYTGNRFMIYGMYPTQNISVWIASGKDTDHCLIAVGGSILNRSSNTDVGTLMAKYGGGGHRKVGTCQVPEKEVDRIVKEITEKVKQDG